MTGMTKDDRVPLPERRHRGHVPVPGDVYITEGCGGTSLHLVASHADGKTVLRELDPETGQPCGSPETVTDGDLQKYFRLSLLTAEELVRAAREMDEGSDRPENAGLPAAGGRIAFLDMQYGHPAPASTESPAGTVTTNPKHRLVTCHWIMNPQFRSAGGNVDGPCFTLIANPNKRPPYLMKNEEGDVPSLSESDSPATREIKEFMRAYGIADIKIRMLRVYELKRIMGFGDGYILKGNQKQQKKFIGNAVETHMAAALCASLCAEVNGLTMTA